MQEKKPKIDIVFCDLDHTLVPLAEHHTTQDNKDAIAQLKSTNKIFVIATGRSLERTTPIGRKLKTDYAICSNGGLVYSFLENKIIHTFNLVDEDVQFLLQNFVFNSDIFFTFYAIDSNNTLISFYAGKTNTQFLEQKVDLTHFQELQKNQTLSDWNVFRINIYGSDSALAKVAQQLEQKHSFSYVLNYSTVLEITALNISKGWAVSFLLKKLNISQNQAIALGDGANDIEMFEAVKYGIALDNANPKLKAIAYAQTDSYDRSGVAKALYKWVL